MPEVLRDLVVTLSLQSDNFSRNINSINRQIREAESACSLRHRCRSTFRKCCPVWDRNNKGRMFR